MVCGNEKDSLKWGDFVTVHKTNLVLKFNEGFGLRNVWPLRRKS